MFSITKSREPQYKCRPHILPCRVSHNGQVQSSKRYWSPARTEGGKNVSYFRGRKLLGKIVKIPGGYQGFIFSPADQKLPKEPPTTKVVVVVEEEEEEEEEEGGGKGLEENKWSEDIGILEEQAKFNEFMIWGHEVLPDEGIDPYIRGVEEWISFAEKIHSYSSPECEARRTSSRG